MPQIHNSFHCFFTTSYFDFFTTSYFDFFSTSYFDFFTTAYFEAFFLFLSLASFCKRSAQFVVVRKTQNLECKTTWPTKMWTNVLCFVCAQDIRRKVKNNLSSTFCNRLCTPSSSANVRYVGLALQRSHGT